jgi:hypothetical protein
MFYSYDVAGTGVLISDGAIATFAAAFVRSRRVTFNSRFANSAYANRRGINSFGLTGASMVSPTK